MRYMVQFVMLVNGCIVELDFCSCHLPFLCLLPFLIIAYVSSASPITIIKPLGQLS